VKYSDKIHNAQLQAVADALGPASTMKIYSGDVPSSCDAANPSGEIAELELPRRPFRTPDGGKLMISEPWSGFAHTDGVAKSFRIADYLGEVHLQGTVSKSGMDGDLQLDKTEIKNGQKIAIGSFTVDMTDVREEQRKRVREMAEA
jgi:hypothetical protein